MSHYSLAVFHYPDESVDSLLDPYYEGADSRWDWWVEGGRWEGLLKVGDKRVNSARVKDIDFDSAPFVTFAVLTPDCEWEEQEPLWGVDSDWNAHYRERFIDTADLNMILTIVDCHI